MINKHLVDWALVIFFVGGLALVVWWAVGLEIFLVWLVFTFLYVGIPAFWRKLVKMTVPLRILCLLGALVLVGVGVSIRCDSNREFPPPNPVSPLECRIGIVNRSPWRNSVYYVTAKQFETLAINGLHGNPSNWQGIVGNVLNLKFGEYWFLIVSHREVARGGPRK